MAINATQSGADHHTSHVAPPLRIWVAVLAECNLRAKMPYTVRLSCVLYYSTGTKLPQTDNRLGRGTDKMGRFPDQRTQALAIAGAISRASSSLHLYTNTLSAQKDNSHFFLTISSPWLPVSPSSSFSWLLPELPCRGKSGVAPVPSSP